MNYQKLASESGLTYQVPSKQIFYGKIGSFMVTLSRRLSAVSVAIAFTGSEEAVSTFFGRLNMYKGNTKPINIRIHKRKADKCIYTVKQNQTDDSADKVE